VAANDDVVVGPADAAELAALAGADVSHLGLLEERWERVTAGNGALLVAEVGGAAVGHVYLWWEDADERELREHLPGVPLIMNLWVRRDQRKRGVGTALIRSAEWMLRRRGHRRVALGVDVGNTVALKFYLGRGYYGWPHEDIKTHRDEFGEEGKGEPTWEVCAVLMKELAGPRRWVTGIAPEGVLRPMRRLRAWQTAGPARRR
jgi:GNAT superfamily N-acetyltransferase